MPTEKDRRKAFAASSGFSGPQSQHDGRLPTLADTVEFFNLILETHLTADEKTGPEAFLRVLWAKSLGSGSMLLARLPQLEVDFGLFRVYGGRK